MGISAERMSALDQRARIDLEVFNNVRNCAAKYVGTIEGKSLLDIGCGKTFPQPLLFNTFGGSSAVGIDVTSFVDIRNLPEDAKYYYDKLAEVAGVPLRFDGLRIMNVNAQQMPFPEGSFDFVISNAAFEHIDDVPAVVSEMKRVMKPGAIGHIGIHLYPSLSGSHHPLLQKDPMTEIPLGLAPWYHLRGIKDYDNTPLNKWREYQYREVFERTFEILAWIVPRSEEGRQFLTPEIKNELKEFEEDELLRRWCVAVIRNR